MQNIGAQKDHDDEQHDIQIDICNGLDLYPFAPGVFHEVNLPARQGINYFIVDGDGLPADQRTHATGQEHPRQRSNEWWDLQIGNQGTHAQPQRYAYKNRERHAQPGVKPKHRSAIGQEHASQRSDRSHGQVDPAGNQHHGHANGGYPDIGVVHK